MEYLIILFGLISSNWFNFQASPRTQAQLVVYIDPNKLID
jgi:hypothetical protein